MGKFDPIFTCCVCGAKLPVLETREEYLDKGCAMTLKDGSMRYFCPGRHTPEEIEDAVYGIPTFQTAAQLKKRIG